MHTRANAPRLVLRACRCARAGWGDRVCALRTRPGVRSLFRAWASGVVERVALRRPTRASWTMVSVATRHRTDHDTGLSSTPFSPALRAEPPSPGLSGFTLRRQIGCGDAKTRTADHPRRPIPTHLKVSELFEILPCAGMDGVYAQVWRGRIDFWRRVRFQGVRCGRR